MDQVKFFKGAFHIWSPAINFSFSLTQHFCVFSRNSDKLCDWLGRYVKELQVILAQKDIQFGM